MQCKTRRSRWQYQRRMRFVRHPGKMLAPDGGHVLAACTLELGNDGPRRFYNHGEDPMHMGLTHDKNM